MTTSTLDLTDLEHLLDAEPECQRKSCERAATRQMRWQCGCMHLVCEACAAVIVAHVTEVVHGGTDVVYCRTCRVGLPGRVVSDVVTVVAL